jgi:hypothetical protein
MGNGGQALDSVAKPKKVWENMGGKSLSVYSLVLSKILRSTGIMAIKVDKNCLEG